MEIWRSTETVIGPYRRYMDPVKAIHKCLDAFAREQNCVTITTTSTDPVRACDILTGFKGVFHVILSHSVYCTSISAGDGCHVSLEGFIISSCSVCILWLKKKKTLTILKGLCNVSIGVCSALYSWILHTAPHTWNEYALSVKSPTIILELLLIKLPVK